MPDGHRTARVASWPDGQFPPLPEAQSVLEFWRNAGPERWFRKDESFDAEFKSRFETAHHAAARGELDEWMNDAQGALALVLLLDQLPRNVWRGSAHMYATDGKARYIARRAVDSGLDAQIPDEQMRAFFYLPFMHSETLSDLERCVALCASIATNNLQYAQHHREIIRRFGRFPHRNACLGRESTPEEERYLEGGGFSG